MTPEQWAKMQHVIKQARACFDQLNAISEQDLVDVIARRENYQKSENFALMNDAAAKRAGVALTQILKTMLFFRGELRSLRASDADEQAAIDHAKKYFQEHPERWGGSR